MEKIEVEERQQMIFQSREGPKLRASACLGVSSNPNGGNQGPPTTHGFNFGSVWNPTNVNNQGPPATGNACPFGSGQPPQFPGFQQAAGNAAHHHQQSNGFFPQPQQQANNSFPQQQANNSFPQQQANNSFPQQQQQQQASNLFTQPQQQTSMPTQFHSQQQTNKPASPGSLGSHPSCGFTAVNPPNKVSFGPSTTYAAPAPVAPQVQAPAAPTPTSSSTPVPAPAPAGDAGLLDMMAKMQLESKEREQRILLQMKAQQKQMEEQRVQDARMMEEQRALDEQRLHEYKARLQAETQQHMNQYMAKVNTDASQKLQQIVVQKEQEVAVRGQHLEQENQKIKEDVNHLLGNVVAYQQEVRMKQDSGPNKRLRHQSEDNQGRNTPIEPDTMPEIRVTHSMPEIRVTPSTSPVAMNMNAGVQSPMTSSVHSYHSDTLIQEQGGLKQPPSYTTAGDLKPAAVPDNNGFYEAKQ